jgi:hypothetical protein
MQLSEGSTGTRAVRAGVNPSMGPAGKTSCFARPVQHVCLLTLCTTVGVGRDLPRGRTCRCRRNRGTALRRSYLRRGWMDKARTSGDDRELFGLVAKT